MVGIDLVAGGYFSTSAYGASWRTSNNPNYLFKETGNRMVLY